MCLNKYKKVNEIVVQKSVEFYVKC